MGWEQMETVKSPSLERVGELGWRGTSRISESLPGIDENPDGDLTA
jgi:hypothetical protein